MKYLKPGDSVGKMCLIPLDVFGVVSKYNKNMKNTELIIIKAVEQFSFR